MKLGHSTEDTRSEEIMVRYKADNDLLELLYLVGSPLFNNMRDCSFSIICSIVLSRVSVMLNPQDLFRLLKSLIIIKGFGSWSIIFSISKVLKGVLSGVEMLQMQICLSKSTIVAIVCKWILMISLLSILFWMNIAIPPLALLALHDF